jgi:hypothetical protein
MVIGNYILAGCTHLQDSISHYYYTVTGDLFVGILCGDALFLLVYKGYDKKDDRWTNIAGILALGIAFFPTNDNSANSCAIIHFEDDDLRRIIHYACAGLFFTILAYISFFLFTKSKGEITKQKIIRNTIYRICGVVIFVSILLIALYGFVAAKDGTLSKLKPIFWLETIALLAFGISWLVKGELVLEDKD